MKRTKQLFILIIIISIKYSSSLADNESILKNSNSKQITLEEAIQLTLTNNFDIKESNLLEKKAYIENKNRLLITLLPSINASVETSNTWKNPNLNNKNSDIIKQSKSGLKSKLNWDLMSVPRKIAKYKVSKKQLQLAKAKKYENIEKKIQETIDKYYNVVINKKKYDVLKNSLNLSKEELEVIEKRYKIGQVARADLLQAQIDFNEVYSSLLEQEQNLILAKFEFKTILGVNEEVEVVDQIPIINEMIWEKMIENFNKNNTSIKVFKYQTSVAKSQDESNGIKLMPNLFAFIGVDLLKDKPTTSIKWNEPMSNIELGMGIKIDLTKVIKASGNKIITNAEFKIKKLRQRIEIAKLEDTLKNNFIIFKHYKERINLRKKNLQSTKKNLKMQIKKFNNGKIKLLELHTAMQQERIANLTLLNDIYAAKKYETTLKQMTGQLRKDYMSNNNL